MLNVKKLAPLNVDEMDRGAESNNVGIGRMLLRWRAFVTKTLFDMMIENDFFLVINRSVYKATYKEMRKHLLNMKLFLIVYRTRFTY